MKIAFAIAVCLSLLITAPLYADALKQGEKAVISGLDFDEEIGVVLQQHGFSIVNDAAGQEGNIAVRNVGYETLYGTQGRFDYVLYAPFLPDPVWIEANNQNAAGTTDEKLPYLFLSALQNAPAQHVILVLGGDGRRAGAMQWIKEAQSDPRWAAFSNISSKRIDVMSREEFSTWLKAITPTKP